MIRKTIVPLAAALLSAGCDGPSLAPMQPPSFGVVSHQRVFVTDAFLSGCDFTDTVVVSGTIHALLVITSDSSGGSHLVSKFDFTRVKGTSQVTGAEYVSHTVSQTALYISGKTLGFDQTSILSFTLTGLGTVPDLVLTGEFHVTIDANGDLTALFSNLRMKC